MLCRQLPLFVEKQMYLKLGSLLLLGCRVLFSIHSHCRHEYGWILNAICRVSECKQIISTVCLTFWHLRGVVAYRMALQSTRIGWMIHTTKAQQICADNIKTFKKKKNIVPEAVCHFGWRGWIQDSCMRGFTGHVCRAFTSLIYVHSFPLIICDRMGSISQTPSLIAKRKGK